MTSLDTSSPPARTGKRKKTVLLVSFVALLGVIVYSVSRRSLDSSTLLGRSRHMAMLSGRISYMGYQWHPDGRVIIERFNNQLNAHEVAGIDPESGKDQVLFKYRFAGGALGFDDAGTLSPDGRWRITTQINQFILNSLDGKSAVTVPNKSM